MHEFRDFQFAWRTLVTIAMTQQVQQEVLDTCLDTVLDKSSRSKTGDRVAVYPGSIQYIQTSAVSI